MGKASTAKRERRRVRAQAFLLNVPKRRASMCESCAFRDPTAYTDDPELKEKIRHCLATGDLFLCHDNMPHDETGRFFPPTRPDGTIAIDTLYSCAGMDQAMLRRYGKGGGT